MENEDEDDVKYSSKQILDSKATVELLNSNGTINGTQKTVCQKTISTRNTCDVSIFCHKNTNGNGIALGIGAGCEADLSKCTYTNGIVKHENGNKNENIDKSENDLKKENGLKNESVPKNEFQNESIVEVPYVDNACNVINSSADISVTNGSLMNGFHVGRYVENGSSVDVSTMTRSVLNGSQSKIFVENGVMNESAMSESHLIRSVAKVSSGNISTINPSPLKEAVINGSAMNATSGSRLISTVSSTNECPVNTLNKPAANESLDIGFPLNRSTDTTTSVTNLPAKILFANGSSVNETHSKRSVMNGSNLSELVLLNGSSVNESVASECVSNGDLHEDSSANVSLVSVSRNPTNISHADGSNIDESGANGAAFETNISDSKDQESVTREIISEVNSKIVTDELLNSSVSNEMNKDKITEGCNNIVSNSSRNLDNDITLENKKSNPMTLFEACRQGDCDLVRSILSSAESLIDINMTDADGWSCLHETSIRHCQFTPITKLLLQNGANANLKDKKGETPLHGAVLFHLLDTIKLLLEYNADFNICNNQNVSPLKLATYLKDNEILLLFGQSVSEDSTVKKKKRKRKRHSHPDFQLPPLLSPSILKKQRSSDIGVSKTSHAKKRINFSL